MRSSPVFGAATGFFSAFFSASETAFSSLNQIRLKSRAEDGDSSAARVLAMAEQYDKLLSTILIGNNIVNIAAASIGTILFTQMLGAERGATVSTIVLTIIVLIFGEVTPKSLAKEMPEKVATAVSPFLVLLMTLMTPLTWLFTQWKKLLGHFVHSGEADTITEGELMTMVSEAENDGELTDRESELIRSAIEFDDVEVEEILTPRVDVIAVEDDMPLEAARRIAPDLLLGRSTHSVEQALEAEKQGADYVNLGPIFPTQTKNTPVHPLGLEIIRNAGPRLSIPFSVMGGVKESNIPQLLKAGARILAMVTELTQADDVAAKARSMRELWKMEGICE
mgnify:CR=1 FL=1